MLKKWMMLALLVGVAFTAGGAMAHQKQERVRIAERRKAVSLKREAGWNKLKRNLNTEIRSFNGQAGVVVEDLRTGRVLVHQPSRPFPAASVIKVPMMTACFQAATEGKLDLNSTVVVRPADKVSGSGVLKAMPGRREVRVSKLIDWMITQSDNTATNVLMSRLGMNYYNRHFQQMGLSGTRLARPMMDFSQRKKGVENTTTAQDMARVLRKLYRVEGVSPQTSRAGLDLLRRQHLHDRIPALLPEGVPVAHKTGLERGVCHDAGIIFTRKGDLLICVLTQRKGKGTSQPAKRFIARLAQHVYRYAEQAP
ncbi:MAG: serine hydrolase [Candidatus Omnitrophota bacterium]|nr:serine hydrolase [Candidatus Omnitrophota bacterium]